MSNYWRKIGIRPKIEIIFAAQKGFFKKFRKKILPTLPLVQDSKMWPIITLKKWKAQIFGDKTFAPLNNGFAVFRKNASIL